MAGPDFPAALEVSYYDCWCGGVPLGPQARVSDADIVQAAGDYLVAYLLDDDDPPRELRLGFDASGRLLETVVLLLDDDELVIHAMKARAQYFDLLP